jgi:hypothetical protein
MRANVTGKRAYLTGKFFMGFREAWFKSEKFTAVGVIIWFNRRCIGL